MPCLKHPAPGLPPRPAPCSSTPTPPNHQQPNAVADAGRCKHLRATQRYLTCPSAIVSKPPTIKQLHPNRLPELFPRRIWHAHTHSIAAMKSLDHAYVSHPSKSQPRPLRRLVTRPHTHESRFVQPPVDRSCECKYNRMIRTQRWFEVKIEVRLSIHTASTRPPPKDGWSLLRRASKLSFFS